MAKTTLTVEVQYDARQTDPEGLASAMDRLLKTALSTPGIMAEYGDPKMGEFFVAPPADNPSEQAQQKQCQQIYTLRIDGPLLRKQRMALLDVSRLRLSEDAHEALEGVTALLDEIGDQAHDRYGIDCLLEEPANDDP